MKILNSEVFNFPGAFRGLRNPMNSWDKSDSRYILIKQDEAPVYAVGEKDMELAQRMVGGGQEESKFMRQIFVSCDIEAPLFWWKEMDTYKVATVANSCSTMHKLTSKEITLDMFSFDDLPENAESLKVMREQIINYCEALRKEYLTSKDKIVWRELIAILPSSFNQKRTWTANYQVLRNIYFQRRNHKLKEWHIFCDWIESLPLGKELICYKKEDKNDEQR